MDRMNIFRSFLRISAALALIFGLLYIASILAPLFEDEEIVIFNNTSEILHLCAMQEHESDCRDIKPNEQMPFNIDYVKELFINKDKIIKLSHRMMPSLQKSEIYCQKPNHCLYAFQIEGNDLFYSLSPKQKFPAKELNQQPSGFPLEIHTLGYNKALKAQPSAAGDAASGAP